MSSAKQAPAGVHHAALPQQEKQTMKTLYIAVLTLAMTTVASAQPWITFRDASGRTTGTVTTDSNGTKTFRDGAGRMTGTATRDSNGTTMFRDGAGRMTGTASAPRRPR
jgi:YD repeat-containing protein